MVENHQLYDSERKDSRVHVSYAIDNVKVVWPLWEHDLTRLLHVDICSIELKTELNPLIVCLPPITTSAKEVMFSSAFVRFFV